MQLPDEKKNKEIQVDGAGILFAFKKQLQKTMNFTSSLMVMEFLWRRNTHDATVDNGTVNDDPAYSRIHLKRDTAAVACCHVVVEEGLEQERYPFFYTFIIRFTAVVSCDKL